MRFILARTKYSLSAITIYINLYIFNYGFSSINIHIPNVYVSVIITLTYMCCTSVSAICVSKLSLSQYPSCLWYVSRIITITLSFMSLIYMSRIIKLPFLTLTSVSAICVPRIMKSTFKSSIYMSWIIISTFASLTYVRKCSINI